MTQYKRIGIDTSKAVFTLYRDSAEIRKNPLPTALEAILLHA